MLKDRRRARRYGIHRMAKLQTDLGALLRDCMITDISRHGARLFAEHIEVSDRFYLLIAGEKGDRRECQVVWRLGGEVGVTFVQPERRGPRRANA